MDSTVTGGARAIIGELGCLDDRSVQAVRGTRLLLIFCPRELGGLEADPVTATLVLEALARMDGPTGWTIGILSSAALFAGPIYQLLLRGEYMLVAF
jgi:alkylation response protein AidB-like acyl-CoA dehydrogenase